MTTLAFDCSNYTSGMMPANLEAIKAQGFTHAIVQAIDPPTGYPPGRTRAQVQACLDAGLTVDAYIWLWFQLGPDDIRRKLALLEGLPIRQLWLDVEDLAAEQFSQAVCEQKIDQALEICDSLPVTGGALTGIYSGPWYWTDRRYVGNTTRYSDRKLWDSDYDGVADAEYGWNPYGGWTSRAIKQYWGTSSVAGISGIDQNVLSVDEEAELNGGGGQPVPECDWAWVEKKDRVVTLAGELRAVADQIEAAAQRKYGPVRGQVLPLADAVRQRADEILA